MANYFLKAVAAALLVMSLVACGGPEDKKAKFYNQALDYYTKGDFAKARIEVKNAIQVDPNYADGYQLLGQIEQKDGKLREAYGAYSKALELNPGLSAAQLEVGRMQLLATACSVGSRTTRKGSS